MLSQYWLNVGQCFQYWVDIVSAMLYQCCFCYIASTLVEHRAATLGHAMSYQYWNCDIATTLFLQYRRYIEMHMLLQQ